MNDTADPTASMSRARTAIGAMLALAVLGYLGYAVWKGLAEAAGQLGSFRWSLYVPVLMLTLVNYGLRYAKWAWLLSRLGVRVPWRTNLGAFVAGLGMVVSPGKAGELVKPWVVREVTGVPIARTLPALVTERLTDGVAVVVLAAFGVSTFAPENTTLIWGTLATVVAGIALGAVALAYDPLTRATLRGIARLPLGDRIAPKLEELVDALRTCLGPLPLVGTILLSLVAWWAECVGYWLVLQGLGVTSATLEASTFLYAFATVFGAPSPGGVGMADVALIEATSAVVPGITDAQAVVAGLLIRFATLWFGVLVGAVALLRLDAIIRDGRANVAT